VFKRFKGNVISASLCGAYSGAAYWSWGFFIIGLDINEPGIGKCIAEVAGRYGIDNLNALFLTPLPGTRLCGTG
jgi:hypothetical protein